MKTTKKNKCFEFTNSGILKLPMEDVFRGGNSKPRNPHMQTMLRMVEVGDNAGSGFPTILATWEAEGDRTETCSEYRFESGDIRVMHDVGMVVKIARDIDEELFINNTEYVEDMSDDS